MVNEPKRNSIHRIFINIYNQMFCFDKAYSLKCLSSDKQGFCCGSRRQLTWERSLVSMNTHTLMSALTSVPRWPTAPLLIVINLTHYENKTGLKVRRVLCL